MVYCLVNRLGYIEGLVQDRSNSIANALEPLQSRTKPSIWPTHVQVILCFYPHNTHCQFNMFCHWLYTYPPQFKWRDWNRKGFIYPCGYQNYKYQFTHGSQHVFNVDLFSTKPLGINFIEIWIKTQQNNFISRKCTWKCCLSCLQNVSHYVIDFNVLRSEVQLDHRPVLIAFISISVIIGMD